MKKIEILAPAGSYESLTAAVNASCDAVYIGGTKFGARAYADNLTGEAMLRGIDYVHVHDKKIYMTVNTLLKNQELENELYEYLYPYYKQGLDAVIVQDAGVLQFIHENFKELPVHASTQMSLTMSFGANVLKNKGVTRIVTARELGLDEIKALRSGTDLEIESFVHGALCYCYSGQCLMSSMIGGRSGNRGRCAQPCRMPYELKSKKVRISAPEEKYLLSPKDICTLNSIPDLIDAGIDSFKIEGRMKRPEYTAGVTAAYRKYVNKYLELGREKYEEYQHAHRDEMRKDITLLKDLYNRGGFTQGYYKERNGRAMMSMCRPNHSGVLVGKVTAVKKNQAVIRLEEDINAQDVLEIRNRNEKLYEFTVKEGELRGSFYSANLLKNSGIQPGNEVYRTKNNLLINRLSEKFLHSGEKIPIAGELLVCVGKPLRLRLTCRNLSTEILGDPVQEALNQPMTVDKLKKQLLKTNDTDFIFHDLNLVMQGKCFVPVQKLNEIRRRGLEKLWTAAAGQYRRVCQTSPVLLKTIKIPETGQATGICAAVSTKDQALAACSVEEVTDIFLESDVLPIGELPELTRFIRGKGKKCYIILPHIFRSVTSRHFLQNKSILTDNTINGYILRNYEEYNFAVQELKAFDRSMELITDYNLYVMNLWAARFWKKSGVDRYTAPVELNGTELKEQKGIYDNIIVYGYLPLMVSAQCLIKTVKGGGGTGHLSQTGMNPCCGREFTEFKITDRYQKEFRVVRHCRDCYNTIYNSQCLSLLSNSEEINNLEIKNIRLNFSFESKEETIKILRTFIKVYCYGSRHFEDIRNITRGHFKRGIE